MSQGLYVPARGERQNHSMVCGCHLLSLESPTPTGRPCSHLLVDVRASKHPSLLKNCPHQTYIGENDALALRERDTWITNNEGRAHIQQLRPPFTHPCPRIHAAYILTRRREGRAHIGLDAVHFAGSAHPCSRTHSSNAFPAEEKTALTFCALSNMFRPNTHRAAQEFGQFSRGWEPTGRRARVSSF